jgi:hypothetical protein
VLPGLLDRLSGGVDDDRLLLVRHTEQDEPGEALRLSLLLRLGPLRDLEHIRPEAFPMLCSHDGLDLVSRAFGTVSLGTVGFESARLVLHDGFSKHHAKQVPRPLLSYHDLEAAGERSHKVEEQLDVVRCLSWRGPVESDTILTKRTLRVGILANPVVNDRGVFRCCHSGVFSLPVVGNRIVRQEALALGDNLGDIIIETKHYERRVRVSLPFEQHPREAVLPFWKRRGKLVKWWWKANLFV